MKQKKLHMIGNSHIDPVWLWQWQEGYQEIKATFKSVLDRMNETEDFLFTGSSAAFYEFVEQNDPEMFAQIKQRVQEGRWEIVGGWWIQPDCNIPSGESFVRQGLVGQRYFQQKFGVTALAGYNPDSFGHHGMLPQILKKSGMPYYIFMRPGPHEKGLPGRLFWWESDDGSQVLTYRIPYEYCTWGGELEGHVRKVGTELKEPFDELMAWYGVGNHGGGPTKANLASIHQMNELPDLPTLELSTPNRYFAAQLKKKDLPIPVVHDDLQHHAPGCYAVHSAVKKWNRESENLLLKAEKFSAIAAKVTGQPYPDFSQAWKSVLFNQFHDIVAGTSLEVAYNDARDLYGEANAIAARGLNHAIQAMAWRVNIPQEQGMKPIVVFNPHAWESRANVELEFGGLKDTDILLDEEGKQVPLQTVRSGATVTGWRKRLSFVADLPAMGYRTYRIITQEPQQQYSPVSASDKHIENDRLRLDVNPLTGLIKLTDKKLGFDIIPVDGARPMVIEDRSDTWSHSVTRYDNVVGRFEVKNVKLIEQGPVKAVIRVTYTYGASTLYQEFAMYRDLNQVEVKVSVDWHEQHKVLKLRFPTGLHFPKATYEIPYGHIERPVDGEEEPGQAWIDLSGVARGSDKIYGLSLLNDGKYSFSVKEREMSLTVLRSPIYAHHDPYVPVEGERYSYMDQGEQHFTYVLLPHEGSWEQGGTVRAAAELNQRPIPLIETYHNGPLPQKDSFVAVDATNVVVSVVKKAEESDDLVIRAYETDKIATKATIRVFGREIAAQFGPCEIKTFVVPVDAAAPVREVNLLEQ